MPFTLLIEVYNHYVSYVYIHVNLLRYVVELLLFSFLVQVYEITGINIIVTALLFKLFIILFKGVLTATKQPLCF